MLVIDHSLLIECWHVREHPPWAFDMNDACDQAVWAASCTCRLSPKVGGVQSNRKRSRLILSNGLSSRHHQARHESHRSEPCLLTPRSPNEVQQVFTVQNSVIAICCFVPIIRHASSGVRRPEYQSYGNTSIDCRRYPSAVRKALLRLSPLSSPAFAGPSHSRTLAGRLGRLSEPYCNLHLVPC